MKSRQIDNKTKQVRIGIETHLALKIRAAIQKTTIRAILEAAIEELGQKGDDVKP